VSLGRKQPTIWRKRQEI